jgi:hypothetical protein
VRKRWRGMTKSVDDEGTGTSEAVIHGSFGGLNPKDFSALNLGCIPA